MRGSTWLSLHAHAKLSFKSNFVLFWVNVSGSLNETWKCMDDILCVVVRLSCFNSGFYFEMWHCDSNDTDVFHVCKEWEGMANKPPCLWEEVTSFLLFCGSILKHVKTQPLLSAMHSLWTVSPFHRPKRDLSCPRNSPLAETLFIWII